MKCQSLFSGENNENIINLSSVKFVHRMEKLSGQTEQMTVDPCHAE